MSLNNSIIPDFDLDTDENLQISLKKLDNIPNTIVIELNGSINTYNSNFFQNQIKKVFNAEFINIIFSCENLNYISSTGIGAFTTFLKLSRTVNGKIILIKIQQKVNEVFQLLGFSQFFLILNDLQDAINELTASTVVKMQIFPKIIECPTCKKHLKAQKAGKFRCIGCKSIIQIDENGTISLIQ